MFNIKIIFYIPLFIGVLLPFPARTEEKAPSNSRKWVAVSGSGEIFLSRGGKSSKELYIPPLLRKPTEDGYRRVNLVTKESEHSFYSNSNSSTLSYNNETYLGPTIYYRKGDKARLTVDNTLPVTTTVHQHGLIIPDYADGTMHQPIRANETWEVEYTVDQNAGTFWYHPHKMGETARQVYYGLAGMIIVEDEDTAEYLPNEYGVDDIPLIIQDKELTRGGQQRYRNNMHTSRMGFIGSDVLVNGKIKPVFSPQKNITRFRLLNASNFGIHKYRFEGVTAYIIANGASFLSSPSKVTSIVLSPGERAEVLVDFREVANSKTMPRLSAGVHSSSPQEILYFDTSSIDDNSRSKIPAQLPETTALNIDDTDLGNLPSRTFRLSARGMNNGTVINNQNFSLTRINFTTQKHRKEIWKVNNIPSGSMMSNIPHSFHVHGTQFRVLSYNKRQPPLEMQGLKDTVLVMPNVELTLLVEFDERSDGVYLYHCHLLEHEDNGMMGQLKLL